MADDVQHTGAATNAAVQKRPRAATRRKADTSSVTKTEPASANNKVVKGVARASKTTRRAARTVSESAKSLGEDVSRRTAPTLRRIAEAPAKAGRRANQAYDATKKAATGRTAVVVGAAAAGLVTGLVVNLGRKVAVQAPSVMAGDWFEAVKLEHQAALSLFDAIEATEVNEPAKRNMLLTQLQHALAKHAFTEENVIYPALREWGDKADADKLNHDHGYVKQHLYELDAIDPKSSRFLGKIAAFRADLEAHIREEEESIFPPLHAAFGEEKNKTITALANKEGFKLA
ncbi:hemerythrin domain-containing protein [Sphingomonas crocodyli]|uniref:Hemerythrin domain-containing protein n=1 Tax=Sphingomonas crocodyli TaxID=1979270 RepID=A0A437LYH6_9SPHN|nr:hemerythrin domain-containing protein [Sphingomonas crocodyli]RVT90460.1 hemerythrin domain-containing protein [Sphingomonas crocodyli]